MQGARNSGAPYECTGRAPTCTPGDPLTNIERAAAFLTQHPDPAIREVGEAIRCDSPTVAALLAYLGLENRRGHSAHAALLRSRRDAAIRAATQDLPPLDAARRLADATRRYQDRVWPRYTAATASARIPPAPSRRRPG